LNTETETDRREFSTLYAEISGPIGHLVLNRPASLNAINDAMLAAYTDERWRARAFAVRYVVSFVGSASAVPLVAYAHRTTGEFKDLFLVLAAFALIMLVAAITLPGAEQKHAAVAA
jgi:hypothetical protein